ncbi:hypothetical protein [Nesterenkonia pannonica]|uniref:hypothetical protein n=1 Tax=Nesterenkonia pannonica TaxID=1548602 RepID=UPI002164E68C|nr:hypothetical protein [Nesterenkonia pannonica]
MPAVLLEVVGDGLEQVVPVDDDGSLTGFDGSCVGFDGDEVAHAGELAEELDAGLDVVEAAAVGLSSGVHDHE